MKGLKKWQHLLAIVVCGLWIFGVWTGYQHLYGSTVTEASTTTTSKGTVTIGYQKGDIFHLAKLEGTLEKKLNKQGYKVKWKQFTDGSALLEALVSGSVDIGRTGNTPPVVSQSSGSDLVYLASSLSKAKGSAILVGENSSITSLSDLKGKTIAVSKGSSAHYFLLKALEKANLSTSDVTIKYLNPSAGRIAFENGNVDAWVVWDPYTAAAEKEMNAKVLTTGTGYTTDRDFVVTTKKYATKNETVTTSVTESLTSALKTVNENKTTYTKKLAKSLGLSESIVKTMMNRRTYGLTSMTTSIIAEQQAIAETFYQAGFITKEIQVKEAVWQTSSSSSKE